MTHLLDLIVQAKRDIEQSQNIEELELIRIEYLGKKGIFTKKITALRSLTPDAKLLEGKEINQAKRIIQEALAERKATFKNAVLEERLAAETLDVSLPGRRIENGGLHPISHTTMRIEHFFRGLGFSIATGSEIEDSYHNFDALNIPSYHPAREDHDTFWFDTTRLLRTQTSSIQIHTMKTQLPPIRVITQGRVYRKDWNQTHTPMFHQMDGLIIDADVSFSNLKSILSDFLQNFFEENLRIRFRPSYFPFTEPSAEVDVLGKNGCWLEVLGCGMVHPSILRNFNIDLKLYSGFAFGIGIERLTMLRYGITDVRVFFENDLRFLKQFK